MRVFVFVVLFLSLVPVAHAKRGGHGKSGGSSYPSSGGGGGIVKTNDLDGPDTATLEWPKEKLVEMEKEQREAGVFAEFDSLTSDEMRMALTTNEWRKRHKLSFLIVDPHLMKAARNARCTASHSPGGKFGEQRAREAGFRGRAWDNVCVYGNRTPEDCIKSLGNDPWGMGKNSNSWTHTDQMAGFYRINGRKVNGHYNRMGVGDCPGSEASASFYGRLDGDKYVEGEENQKRIPVKPVVNEKPVQQTKTDSFELLQEEQDLLNEVNEARRKNGKRAVSLSRQLTGEYKVPGKMDWYNLARPNALWVAHYSSKTLTQGDHTMLNVPEVITTASNANEAVQHFLKSPPHRKALLDSKSTEVGLGVSSRMQGGKIWVVQLKSPSSQVFLKPPQSYRSQAEAEHREALKNN